MEGLEDALVLTQRWIRMKGMERKSGKACRGRGRHFIKKSKRKRFGMKLEGGDFMYWFH